MDASDWDDLAAEVLGDMMTGTYSVERRKRAHVVKGIAVPDPFPETLPIIASVQPAKGRELLRLPEERRTIETRLLFTTTQLLTGGAESKFEADRVIIDGQPWEVQNSESWPGHYRVMVQVMVPQ